MDNDIDIAGLLTREKELMAKPRLSPKKALELKSVRDKESKLLDIKSKLLEKESKLLEKENLLLGKALPAAGAWVPPRAPIAFE